MSWLWGGDQSLLEFLKHEAIDIAGVTVGRYGVNALVDKILRNNAMAKAVVHSLTDMSAVASLIYLTQKSDRSIKDFVPNVSPIG